MSFRKVAVALAVVCASLLVVPVVASAKPTAKSAATAGTSVTTLKHIAVSGTGKNGKKFTGHFTVTQFVTRHGKTYAVGNLTGKLGHRHINKSNVAFPTNVMPQGTNSAQTTAACPILHLVLGPLNLNLLGLHVHLNQVVLDVTAQSGPGNLLGNLLCGVANLLNGTGGSSLLSSEVTGLLNIVQQLLNVPALSTF